MIEVLLQGNGIRVVRCSAAPAMSGRERGGAMSAGLPGAPTQCLSLIRPNAVSWAVQPADGVRLRRAEPPPVRRSERTAVMSAFVDAVVE